MKLNKTFKRNCKKNFIMKNLNMNKNNNSIFLSKSSREFVVLIMSSILSKKS